MESRGSVNGSEINALPLNAGTFLVDCAAVATVSVAPSLSLIRRLVSVAAAIITVPGTMLLTARRSGAALMTITVSPSARMARRATSRMASQIGVAATMKLVRRVAPVSSTDVRIDAAALLSWRFIRRTDQQRIMRLERARHSLVYPENRRMTVPASRNMMQVPRCAEVMP
ncbi:hypothetical protein GGQ73_003013 [Rhizobium skierniewicense]|uniref:Uncharacterized protein n=1 Tax=Rhizobium skierniewicense TaxID=984260 RepID=A0A7W6C9R9_9HYPH|nr:hypothetical protein [Rhizobium skierniewicense]MBB3947049.1 hypothetical protein [Rhizobium skierniewicense]